MSLSRSFHRRTIALASIAVAIGIGIGIVFGGTMEPEWRFEQDERGGWRWFHMDGQNETVSTETFPDQVRCMMDAIRFVVRLKHAQAKRDGPDRAAQTH